MVACFSLFFSLSAFLMGPFLHDFVIYMHTHAHGKREVFTFAAHVPRMFGTSPVTSGCPRPASSRRQPTAALIGKCHAMAKVATAKEKGEMAAGSCGPSC